MITLAESGFAPPVAARADLSVSAVRAVSSTQNLHHELALAVQEHRCARLQEANVLMAMAAVQAQAEVAAAEQARRRQAEFLAVVVHELRNPLTPIRTAAHVLGRMAAGADADGDLARLQAIIERQVVHLSRLIDDLLDLSRARTGKFHLECAVVDLKPVVEAVAEARRPAMQERGQRLAIVMPALALEVDGDPVRLAQVIGNLLDNASKFTPAGGAIELLAAVAGDLVVVSISDSGIGIAPEALPHVFEPFAQGVHVHGAGGGLGLGLAVVSELVEAHGGSVVAHSAGSGSGSRFVVTLPRARTTAGGGGTVAPSGSPAS